MDFNFNRGDKLILELINSDEILEGEFVDGAKDRIVLVNITSYKSKVIIRGPYCYYRSDITSVRLLNAQDNIKDMSNNDTVKPPHSRNAILISKSEYERLKEMSRNYVYMSTLDSRYYDAMDCINNCETVGVSAITTSYEKNAYINLLVMSTWNKVYIFDFVTINMQKFPPELKEILECEYIKKVFHDSRLLTEVLLKRCNVKLKNFFDTKVADVVIRKRNGEDAEHTKDLSECLTHYFNLPTTLLAPQDTTLEKWQKRPLSDIRKYKAAQRAAFLITLKNKLERQLLESYYTVAENYAKSLNKCCMQDVPRTLFDKKLCDVLDNIKLS